MDEYILPLPPVLDIDNANRVEIRSVKFVPVVRCEDCKHFKELPDGNDGVCWRDNKRDYCGIYGVVNGKWYCADGKRREENEAD